MEYRDIAILSGVIGLIWALANWTMWQTLKEGTIIPSGSMTLNYGAIMSVSLKVIGIIITIFQIQNIGWMVIPVLLIAWYLGSKIASLLESMLYGKSVLAKAPRLAKSFIEELGQEDAQQMWQKALPRWWINRMTRRWEMLYREAMVDIFPSSDPSDPLYKV